MCSQYWKEYVGDLLARSVASPAGGFATGNWVGFPAIAANMQVAAVFSEPAVAIVFVELETDFLALPRPSCLLIGTCSKCRAPLSFPWAVSGTVGRGVIQALALGTPVFRRQSLASETLHVYAGVHFSP